MSNTTFFFFFTVTKQKSFSLYYTTERKKNVLIFKILNFLFSFMIHKNKFALAYQCTIIMNRMLLINPQYSNSIIFKDSFNCRDYSY